MRKAALKRAAFDEAMKEQPKETNKARWIRHVWCETTDSLKTQYWLPAFPGAKGWHREGSLNEIEQRENAGRRSLFR